MSFDSVSSWLDHCRYIVQHDQDNVVLLAGDPGNGKSTLLYQLARSLDPEFDETHMHFTIQDFLADAKKLPFHRAVAADELLMHRRKGHHGDSIQMIDFLQVCRGLNLHIFLCFPHAAQLDRAVLDRRVRYRIDIDKPRDLESKTRTAHVSERQIRTVYDGRGQEEYAVNWKHVLSFRFTQNSGPLWENYLAKKLLAARMRDASARGKSIEEAIDLDLGSPVRREYKRAPKRDTGNKGKSGVRITFRVRETSPLYEKRQDEPSS